jgi:AAA+ ATPase superfamily predicted ATPase
MEDIFVGREAEQQLLEDLYAKRSSELVSITGRRRVGKTHLVNTVFKGRQDFYLTGIQNYSTAEQLKSFAYRLAELKGRREDINVPESWQDAFMQLTWFLDDLKKEEKLVVFLDELPWLATARSGFLSAFSHFWNAWAEQKNILVIICGSAASWMINKVVRNQGGLHNRITKRIQLEPFTLHETSVYLQAKGFALNHYSFLEQYMIFGGIPHYLKELDPAESGIQNIDRVCFAPDGLLHDEFSRLYPSLFDHAERHMAVVRVLGAHTYGLNRTRILKETKMKDGGGMTRILEELEFSGFIKSFYPFKGKRNGRIYRLIDEYSFFYLRFIEPNRKQGAGTWLTHSQTASYRAWSGYAFENVGLRHLPQIKKALGVGSVATVASTFYHKGKGEIPGLQIDLVLSRADRSINLCEFKFHSKSLSLSSAEAARYLERLQTFRELTGTTHVLFNSMVSTFGFSQAKSTGGAIAQSVTMEALFEAL